MQVEIVMRVIILRKKAFIAMAAFLLALIGAFFVYLNPTVIGFLSIVISLPFTAFVVSQAGPLWIVRRITHVINERGEIKIKSMELDSTSKSDGS